MLRPGPRPGLLLFVHVFLFWFLTSGPWVIVLILQALTSKSTSTWRQKWQVKTLLIALKLLKNQDWEKSFWKTSKDLITQILCQVIFCISSARLTIIERCSTVGIQKLACRVFKYVVESKSVHKWSGFRMVQYSNGPNKMAAKMSSFWMVH